ncbi:MAG: cyclic beta 1-2 glucan synthetase, partial [Coriobacteriia bacterium]|nr:cyclic beta 1-2 glucan synthetase [Coriobacteriia bacterium]
MSQKTERPATPDSRPPFRAELYSEERLAQCGRELAQAQSWTSELAELDSPLSGLLRLASEELAQHYALLSEAVRLQHPISPAAEWLLDNYYLIDEQMQLIRDDLPANYSRELPWLTSGPFAHNPRIFEAVTELLSHTDARIDETVLSRFIGGFQDVSPLSIGEIWGIPIALRIALVENLRRLSGRVVAAHISTRAADEWADALLTAVSDSADSLREMVAQLETQADSADSVFLMRLAQRLSGQDTGIEVLGAWLERRFHDAGIDLDELAHGLQQVQAADQVSIANSITSIRFLDAYEWRGFFEHSSFVEQILREDPIGVYPRMDFKSRDRYRHALEGIARRCPLDEITVAEAVVSWTLDSLVRVPSDEIAAHVGHYLISSGRFKLETSVEYRPRMRERLYRGPLARKGLFDWGMLGGTTLVLAVALLLAIALSGAKLGALLALGLVALIPLSDLALTVTNRVSTWVFPPRMMPKLDYLSPVSEAHRTLVVIPALFSSPAAVRHVLDNLEIAYLANRDEQVVFGVLGDLKTSAEEHLPTDDTVISAAVDGIEMLNTRYLAEHGRSPFCLFIRERRYDPLERSWMGWERKRGALVELNRALRGSTATSFSHRVAQEEFLASVTFVITLDSDTVLARDGARKLVSTIAHPLNRAILKPGDKRVGAGYGLIQPRVGMSLPASSRSFFAWLYSGVTGVDPYVGAVSDTYQDVFGEGSFTGKGIYEVSVFNAVLEGRFPDDTLLSHDLIEGC